MSCQFWGRARLLVERPYRNLLIALSGGRAIVGGGAREGEGEGRKFGEIFQPRLVTLRCLTSKPGISLSHTIDLPDDKCMLFIHLFVYSYNITWISLQSHFEVISFK